MFVKRYNLSEPTTIYKVYSYVFNASVLSALRCRLPSPFRDSFMIPPAVTPMITPGLVRSGRMGALKVKVVVWRHPPFLSYHTIKAY